ncbi:MAG: hypothetical protein IKQ31_03540 [Clostridia bacterium]|nr:hypothetical protein [Clostridia bacterium]
MQKELESLFFYTRNDYLIVNNLLLDNLANIEHLMQVVNQDYEWMIEEMKNDPAKRLGLEKSLAEEVYKWYQQRYQTKIDVDNTLSRAKEDIKNLQKLCVPTSQKKVLYRNIKSTHLSDFENKKVYNYPAFASCLNKSTDVIYSYGPKDKYIELVINVPQEFPIIDLDKLPEFVTNEEGEVILPPFSATIKSIKKSNQPKCVAVVELELKD